MRMDEMNRLFEDEGFTVERKYEDNGYRFTINKDDNHLSERFVYPCGANSGKASQIQRDFVKNMIARFYNEFSKFKIGDRVMVTNTNFNFKKEYIGHSYTIKDIEPSSADLNNRGVRYVMDDPQVTYIFYESELELVKHVRNDGLSAYAVAVAAKDFINNYKEGVKMEEKIRSYFTKVEEIIPLSQQRLKPKIQNVIFNDPATIVFWTDGTKTVVKCQDGDEFDPEKGLALAIIKKALGNKGNYCNELKKWLPKDTTTTILLDGTKLRKAIYAANRLPFVEDDLRKYKEALQKACDISKGISDAKSKEDMAHMLVDMRDCLREALED